MELTVTPSPWTIRATAKNRVDNQLARTPVANHRRRRSLRLQTRFTRFAPHSANRSPTPGPPGEPPHTPPRDGGVAAAERLFAPRSAKKVKRFGSGPIGDGSDSPRTRRSARYRHDCSRLRGSGSAVAGSGSTCADEPFFRGVEPERRPQPPRRRLASGAAPVSRH